MTECPAVTRKRTPAEQRVVDSLYLIIQRLDTVGIAGLTPLEWGVVQDVQEWRRTAANAD